MDNDLNNEKQNDNILYNSWKLWYHAPDNKNWNIDSYKELYTISNITDFWYIFNRLDNNHLQYGMFFLMKNNILPMWEDEHNKNGGCWALKVMKKDTFNVWLELSMALIGEYIMSLTENSIHINGITISPKKKF